MLVEALAFAIASLVHSGPDRRLCRSAPTSPRNDRGGHPPFGAVVIILQPAWTRVVGASAQGFALLGSLIGTYLAFRGLGPNTVPDLVFHVAVVITLALGVVAALREPVVRHAAYGATQT